MHYIKNLIKLEPHLRSARFILDSGGNQNCP